MLGLYKEKGEQVIIIYLGSINYKMITPQFQLADEMASNLRQVKANDSLIVEQMDTFYRKKNIEMDEKK